MVQLLWSLTGTSTHPRALGIAWETLVRYVPPKCLLMMEDGSYEEMALGAGIGWCRLDDFCFVHRVSAASNHQQLPWLFLGEVVRTLQRYCSIFVDLVDV